MEITYLEAIRQALWEEMDRDEQVFMLGEDIGVYGGAFKVTKGFLEKFGQERVIDTPLSESAIVGAAIGAVVVLTFPGLEIVDIPQLQAGNSCLEMWAVPDLKQADRARFVAAAAEAGVTTLAGIYHICHRELCAHEREWPFEFVNFMELIGESMGVIRADTYKRLRLMEDVDAILADSAELIALHGLDQAALREEIVTGILDERPLGA